MDIALNVVQIVLSIVEIVLIVKLIRNNKQ